MKMAGFIFREFLLLCADADRKEPGKYKDKTNDEIWRELSPDQKILIKQMAYDAEPDLDWLEIEDWLEDQFREDVKKDFVDVACLCLKEKKLSREMIVTIASVSASARDTVLAEKAVASRKRGS